MATNVTAKDTCDATDSMTTRMCEGIIRAYRLDTSLQKKINDYVQYCAIMSSTMYVAETVLWNGLSQVFAQFCTPNKVAYQTHVKYFSVQNDVMFCKYCNCLFVITETVFQV